MGIKKNSGFTLLEVIAVLIIMGIITAFVIGRMSLTSTDVITRTEVIKSHLRYAQSRAMNSSMVWGINFNNNSYWLFNNGNTNNRITLPGEDSNTITMSSGMSAGTGIVSFDSWGKPYTDAGAQTLQASDRTITISKGGDSRSVIITKNTGFVQ